MTKITKIYQTLEDRQNDKEVEENGPFLCQLTDLNGQLKRGIKEPWLGEGYYFWDTRLEDAIWWGNSVYGQSGYIVCQTTYDQHSPLLFDLVGDIGQFDEFIKCADLIMSKIKEKFVTFPVVLSFLKKTNSFNYKAIRVRPVPIKMKPTNIRFPGEKTYIMIHDKVQICFFDKTLLRSPFKIVYKQTKIENQII